MRVFLFASLMVFAAVPISRADLDPQPVQGKCCVPPSMQPPPPSAGCPPSTCSPSGCDSGPGYTPGTIAGLYCKKSVHGTCTEEPDTQSHTVGGYFCYTLSTSQSCITGQITYYCVWGSDGEQGEIDITGTMCGQTNDTMCGGS